MMGGMVTRWQCLVVLFALSSPIARGEQAKAADPQAEAAQWFRNKGLPLLQAKCVVCHGNDPKKLHGDLDLRTRAGMMAGGKSGTAAIIAGDPDRSLLYQAVARLDPKRAMPPKENDRLTGEEVAGFRLWIAAGAPWPEGILARGENWSAADGITVATSGGRTPDWTERKYRREDLWAYRPIARPAVPAAAGTGNALDAFLRQKMHGKGIVQTAPPADKRTLLRRATFDLLGLPPTPEEMEAFLRDDSPEAFACVVERLLASPHHGEQWARHWLDVVRYADTSGFANDYERPNAWRYRDYVVRSFNQDKAYDRFLLEQIAGDELEPENPEMLIAVGFLRMGPWEQTGMSVAAVTRQHFLDDVTHAVGVTVLGQGLRCARCHDHKFDPVPTKDYYRMQAVFAPVQFAERDVPFLASENSAGFAEGRAISQRRLREAQEAQAKLRAKNQAAVAAYLKQRGVARWTDLPETDRPERQKVGLSTQELSVQKIQQKRSDYFERELERFEPRAFSVYNGPLNAYSSNKALNQMPAARRGAAQAIHILPGGALETPAETVTPGLLSAVAAFNSQVSCDLSESMDGRRLAFARWVVSPRNPLTARVIVNRVWQHHFGKGLVGTPNNFGKMGKKPTHPELLDWLAVWFMDHGWSLKQLHRLIMTSEAYRQGGSHPEMDKLRQLDPNNDLLAYYPPRRLAAEEIRDSLLALSGECNREQGGPGTFPEINWEVALQPRHIMGSVAPAYQPSPTPRQRNRRTLYAFRYRTLADPLLEVFNRPGSETSCDCRDNTTVTPQVFALFNGEFAHDRALALAAALEKSGDGQEPRIVRAFQLFYGREPSAAEIDTCQDHLAKMTKHHREHPAKAEPLPRHVHRRMIEELTGEEFGWDEELDGLTKYQRDLKPWDVGPTTRALADLCLVLVNSNEFLYVR